MAAKKKSETRVVAAFSLSRDTIKMIQRVAKARGITLSRALEALLDPRHTLRAGAKLPSERVWDRRRTSNKHA